MAQRLFVICYCCLLLVACQPASPAVTPIKVAVPVTINPTRLNTTPTAQISVTTIASPSKEIARSTLIPDSLVTISPSPTLRPTLTSIPLPTPTPDKFDLPAWLGDPETIVLATFIGYWEEGGTMSFLNLNTRERFELPTPPYTRELTWGQDNATRYFEYDLNELVGHTVTTIFIERVYLTTGEFTHLEPPPVGSGRVVKSPNGRHQARITSDNTITIEDTQTGQTIMLEDSFRSRYPDSGNFSWSPSGDLLAVVRYDFDDSLPTKGGLAIYTLGGAIYRQYSDITSLNWAPDDTFRILYGEMSSTGHYRPCVLNIQDSTSQCIEEIAEWGKQQGVRTGLYRWLPDANQISFIYWNYSPEIGGLCMVNLNNTEITCPITEQTLGGGDESDSYDPSFIVWYEWSPDGRYLWLHIDPFGLESDDRSFGQIATVARDGTQFQVWGYGSEAFWRPAFNE